MLLLLCCCYFRCFVEVVGVVVKSQVEVKFQVETNDGR